MGIMFMWLFGIKRSDVKMQVLATENLCNSLQTLEKSCTERLATIKRLQTLPIYFEVKDSNNLHTYHSHKGDC